MSVDKNAVLEELERVQLPDGRNLVSADMVRGLNIDGSVVRFVLEVPAEEGPRMEPVRAAAQKLIAEMAGVTEVHVILTSPTSEKQPPNLKIGGHPKPQDAPISIPGVDRIVAIASGKGGVGKSTVSANLAVALAKAGRRVGLLDADIYGPSQPRMMGVSKRPASPDGKTIIPLQAHGVTMMSLGLMVKEDEAVIWRGPMLMGALQQMLGQVEWGELDVLLIDLPPGTGDVQLTLSQKAELTGALVVSTPQDIALLDARKALNMFDRMKTPVLGLIENMSHYICPNCGDEAHIFGHGGARAEAEKLGLPFLGEIPLDLEIRVASDGGTPLAATQSKAAEAYHAIAQSLIEMGKA